MLIDTHCHLDFPEFDQDREEVISRAKNEGIGYIVNIGSSLEGSEKALELAGRYDFIYATVGIHPHEADKFNDKLKVRLEALVKKDKVSAIGETGLDYYLPAGQAGKNYSQAENQKALFVYLVNLAKDSGLPLVIHTRQAQADTLKVLKEAMPVKAVIHCFSGDGDFLKESLDLGFLVSFTCNITYKKAQDLRGIVKLAPLERIMLETDAPFLPPEGLRGMRNDPAQVKLLAGEIAHLKETSVAEVARVTTLNAKDFFRLP
ncbi:MAG: TatD family hydrolase [Candidatus Omnitrophica bacterium]|nr:TatD family hydrolase [Candidatus Omnitrophota bacterium]MDD5592993.1 TatD family hydrolase [Candidatus Omnitrophota bacterium]